jgi:hypothetical protein
LIGIQAPSGIVAIAARMLSWFGTVMEKCTSAASRQAATSLGEKNALSARRRIVAVTPAARSTLIASLTSDAAPRPDPALPARSLVATITGRECGVEAATSRKCGPRTFV